MAKFRKIGILSSGGDAPGMNAAIRAAARRALSQGIEVVGILGGYAGLLGAADESDPEVIRKEIETSVKLCQKYGCPAEFILKDISTVSHRPENLIVWAQVASEVLDHYYGEA